MATISALASRSTLRVLCLPSAVCYLPVLLCESRRFDPFVNFLLWILHDSLDRREDELDVGVG